MRVHCAVGFERQHISNPRDVAEAECLIRAAPYTSTLRCPKQKQESRFKGKKRGQKKKVIPMTQTTSTWRMNTHGIFKRVSEDSRRKKEKRKT